ncbi:MAG: general secretion pathway protein GspB [Pseudomonadales bacterium]|jgi:general secretion pathway protein B|nr:general secretion pathway protein GspB [Pseudomonadales bacterium]
MSYILDALNKSEQERARKRAPGLAALHGDREPRNFTLKHFLLILLALVFVNLAGIYLLFGDRLATATTTPTEIEISTSRPSELVTPTTEPVAPAIITPPKASEAKTPDIPDDYEAVAVGDLPLDIQMRLPVIEVTTHIYASDPELRMVKIDGVPRYEGDILTTDFRLLEITETGVAMEFEGYAYVLDVIEEWLE